MPNKIYKIKTYLNSFVFEKMPYNLLYWLVSGFGIIKNFFKILRYLFMDISHVEILQPSVQLDASTMCQLKCPVCPTSKGINRKGVVGISSSFEFPFLLLYILTHVMTNMVYIICFSPNITEYLEMR